MKKIWRHLTFANVVACLALFIALGGAGYAALKLPSNSVGTKQLKKGAVTAAKVKRGSLLAKDFKAGQLPRGAVGPTGAQGATGPQGPAGTDAGSAAAALPHARIQLASHNQTMPGTSGRVEVEFDSVVEDNAGMADLLTHPVTLRAPRTGLYFVAGLLGWRGIKGSGRFGGVIQATSDPAGTKFFVGKSVDVYGPASAGLDYLDQPLSEVMRLSAGQYVALVAYQNSGSTYELTDEDEGCWLEMTYLGP